MKNIFYPISAAALLITLLLALFNPFDATNDQVIVHPASDVKELLLQKKQLEAKAFHLVDSLQQKNKLLDQQLAVTQTELKKVKQKSALLQNSLQQVLQQAEVLANSLQSPVYDSLVTTSKAYLKNSSVKDSLYESAIQSLEQKISFQDVVISTKDRLYDELKNSFQNCVAANQTLLVQQKDLAKQYKRQKRTNRFLKGFLLLLSGAVTYSAIH